MENITGKSMGKPAGRPKLQAVMRALLISYLLTAALLAALAFLLYRFRLGETQVNIGVNAVYIVSCLAGGLSAGRAIRQRRFLWGLLAGTVYFLILLFVSFAMNRQLGADSPELLTVFLMCAGSATLGGMVS